MTGLRHLRRVTLPVLAVAVAALFIPNVVSAFWLRSLMSAVIFALPALGIAILFSRLRIAALAQVGLVACGGWCALRLSHGTDLPFLGVRGSRRHRRRRTRRSDWPASAEDQGPVSRSGDAAHGGTGLLGRDTVGGRVAMARPGIATSDAAYFRFIVVITALCFAAVAVLRVGRLGRMWAIIGQGDPAAAAVGINVTAVRTVAFVLAGFLSGVAGGLLAGGIGFLDPTSFAASESMLLFALVLAAGTRSLFGAVVAALLYRALPSLLDEVGVAGDTATVLFGVALIHAMVTGNDGITGQLGGLGRTLRRRLPVSEVGTA